VLRLRCVVAVRIVERGLYPGCLCESRHGLGILLVGGFVQVIVYLSIPPDVLGIVRQTIPHDIDLLPTIFIRLKARQ
jgi:hypothetical protein